MADEQEFDAEQVPDIPDEQLEEMLENFTTEASNAEIGELFNSMNENNIIQWGEVEHYMSGRKQVVKSGLPAQMKPTEPDNSTDVDSAIEKMRKNEVDFKELNLNNMKPLLEALESNTTLLSINLETNYLSGKFLVRLFQKLLPNQTVEEVRVTNQSITYSTQDEMEIAEAVEENETLLKLGMAFRKHEARTMVDNALYRNNEIRESYLVALARFRHRKLSFEALAVSRVSWVHV